MQPKKDTARDLATSTLGSLFSYAILVIGGLLIAGTSYLVTSNIQLALLVLLILLVLLCLLTNLVVLRQQQSMAKTIAKLGLVVLQQQESMAKAMSQLGQVRELLPTTTARDDNPLATEARRRFPITDKRFDSSDTPQKIVVEFTNRATEIIEVERVRYSDSHQLPNPLANSYMKDDETNDYLVPFDRGNARVLPGKSFTVELCLAQIWTPKDINALSGRWGYFYINVIYKGQRVEIFESF